MTKQIGLRFLILIITSIAFVFAGCSRNASVAPVSGSRVAELTVPPLVPKRIAADGPQKVVVNLEVREVVKQLAMGTTYTYWTFGGCVPGKFIRVNEGDLVEIHLSNPSGSKMPHSIDLHAVSGPGGGAEASFTAPGHTSVFSFRALKAGLYIYHCAAAPVPLHIANGMYGLIYVDSREHPLPVVDREFYIMQSEIYTTGQYGDTGLQQFSFDKGLAEQPTYVVFNGSVGSLLGPNALHVKVGETVRLFVGNAGPNLTSSFHIIGVTLDNVYQEGGTEINHNVATTLIPVGGSAIVEFKAQVPGTYHMVDHSIFRAFNQGAVADIVASGAEDSTIYSHQQRYENYSAQ
jgi:nitrite reductase (NO-forming)